VSSADSEWTASVAGQVLLLCNEKVGRAPKIALNVLKNLLFFSAVETESRRARPVRTKPRQEEWLSSPYRAHQDLSICTISGGGVLAHRRGFGTFGWICTGRCSDSELEVGKTYYTSAVTPPASGVPPPRGAGRIGGAQPGRGHPPDARAMAQGATPLSIAAHSAPSGADWQVETAHPT
jgi:hypothetical protein